MLFKLNKPFGYCHTLQYYVVLVLVVVVTIAVFVSYSPSPALEFSLPILQHGSSRGKGGQYGTDWNKTVMKAKGLIATFRADILEKNKSSGHHSHDMFKKQYFEGKLVKPITPNPNMGVPVYQPMKTENTKFSIPFHFVHRNFVKSPKEISSSPWLIKLQEMLRNRQDPSRPISVVFSDSEYVESLLNWLIASQLRIKPPLRNLIVICLDEMVFSMLDRRDIPSIFIDPAMVLNANYEENKKRKYEYIWIMRFVVYRIITYFGYDVTSYDTDAILMQNLQPLLDKYQDSDIVGSAGHFPFPLGRLWGFTVCMGVIHFRSSPDSELMWELMSNTMSGTYDDQAILNFALKKCEIKWQASQNSSSSINTSPISGNCFLPPYQGFKVTVLPRSDICRQCKENKEYVVAHPLSDKKGAAKVAIAVGSDWWSLRKDWKRSSPAGHGSLKSIEWLATLVNTSSN